MFFAFSDIPEPPPVLKELDLKSVKCTSSPAKNPETTGCQAAFDGVTGKDFLPAVDASTMWIKVDFQRPVNLKKLEVYDEYTLKRTTCKRSLNYFLIEQILKSWLNNNQ